jgi:phosphatidylglycerophosphate synthase
MPEMVKGRRKVWNPLSRYYVEPFGEYIGNLLAKTPITPNIVTSINVIGGCLASLLIFLGGPLNLIIFAVWVQLFHALDITDGQLARLKEQKTTFGAWYDRAGDRFVENIWIIAIAYVLFSQTNNAFYLWACIVLLFGKYLYSFLSLTTDIYYKDHVNKDKLKTQVKSGLLSKIFLFFIDQDVTLHFLSITAIFNRFDVFLVFYSVYFNLIWIAYFGYYAFKYLKTGQ